MECVLSGDQVKALHRAVVCLSRIGTELVFEAVPDKLRLQTLSTAKSAFLSVSLKAQFFDVYHLLVSITGCRVLLKSVCSVFRTPPGSMGRLSITLPDRDATRMQWTVECYNGLRKTYWISCQEELSNQHVAVDRSSLPSYVVVKPRDFNRLLGNFQPSLQELTLFATEPSETPAEAETGTESKAIELRSYTDFVKDTTDGGALHTQLWIDPAEELVSYSHVGPPVDVTFSLKEIKAFLVFCEGCEADMQFNFEKAGRPILLAPKMGVDNANSDIDSTLVLATMLSSQLDPEAHGQQFENDIVGGRRGSQDTGHTNTTPNNGGQRVDTSTPGSADRSANRSDHTVVWSDLSGSAGRTSTTGRLSRRGAANATDTGDATDEVHRVYNVQRSVQTRSPLGSQERLGREDVNVIAAREWDPSSSAGIEDAIPGNQRQNEMGNIVGGDEEDFCIQSTPPDRRYGYD